MNQQNSTNLSVDHNECPICHSKDLWVFLELLSIPTQDGVVWDSKEQALNSPVGDIQLAYCSHCDLIGNQKHDPDKVQFSNYDFTLHHSPFYQEFIQSLAGKLVERYKLHDKTLVDLGCGAGHFLKALCELGNSKGIGIDPSLNLPSDLPSESGRVTLIKDYYSEKYSYLHADFISCRHVIDELENPVGFVNMVRDSLDIADNTIVYMEVPNAVKTFTNDIVWNIGYAKHFWFTPLSLTALFERCNFEVLNVETCLVDEYLSIEAKPCQVVSQYKPENHQAIQEYLEDFSNHYSNVIETWQNRMDDLERQGRTVAVWGAGMRAINFLNRFADKKVISYVVDVNPARQGKFLPRSAYKVEAPEKLKDNPPDVILISNPTYAKEIQAQAEDLGVSCDFLVL